MNIDNLLVTIVKSFYKSIRESPDNGVLVTSRVIYLERDWFTFISI